MSISLLSLFKLLIARCLPVSSLSSPASSSCMRIPECSSAFGHMTGDYISPLLCSWVRLLQKRGVYESKGNTSVFWLMISERVLDTKGTQRSCKRPQEKRVKSGSWAIRMEESFSESSVLYLYTFYFYIVLHGISFYIILHERSFIYFIFHK